MLIENWPFEVGRYILNLHDQRLHLIAKALNLDLEQVTQQLAEHALAQSGGQHGAPNGNAQEQFRHDNQLLNLK